MSQPPQVNLQALWRFATDRVKATITLPSLWRAMEAARPLALEDDHLILGFGVGTAHQSGLLLDTRNRNTIEQALEMALRKRTRIRVINGDTIEDWESIKAAELEAKRLQEETRQAYTRQTEAGDSWEAVSEKIVRKVNTTANRTLPSIQAKLLVEAIETLSEGYRRLMPRNPDELEERAYSRALDRVAERLGVPSSVLAYLVLLDTRKPGADGAAGSESPAAGGQPSTA